MCIHFFAFLSQCLSITYYPQELYKVGTNIPTLQIQRSEGHKLNSLHEVIRLLNITALRYPEGQILESLLLTTTQYYFNKDNAYIKSFMIL